MTLACLELKVKVTAQVRQLRLVLKGPVVMSDGRQARFLLSRHQLRTSKAKRAAWRSPVRVGVVTE